MILGFGDLGVCTFRVHGLSSSTQNSWPHNLARDLLSEVTALLSSGVHPFNTWQWSGRWSPILITTFPELSKGHVVISLSTRNPMRNQEA